MFHYLAVLNTEGSIVWGSGSGTRPVTQDRVPMTCPPSETSSVVTSTLYHTRASFTSGKQSSTEVSRSNFIQAVLVFVSVIIILHVFMVITTFCLFFLFFVFSVNPCELHCRPLNEHFSEKMQDAVIDGTPCYEGNKSRDMCINGICKVFHVFSDKIPLSFVVFSLSLFEQD